MSIIKWIDLTTKQLDKLDRKKIVVIPAGAIESHGNHLGLSTDIEIAKYFSKILVNKYNSVLFPPLSFGPCETLLGFPGTATISEKTYYSFLKDIILSIIHHSFFNICIINGHGGNTSVLQKITKNLKKTHPKLNLQIINWFESPYITKLKNNDSTYKGDHGDRLETEMMMLAKPSSVLKSEAIDDLPEWPDNADDLTDYSQVMTHSVEGFPSKASINTAKIHFKSILEYIYESFEERYGK